MKSSFNIFSSTRIAYQNWREPEHLHTLAGRYWHFMLSVSLCVMLGMIAYAAFSLFSIDDTAGGRTTSVAPLSLDKGKLTKLLAGLAERQAAFEALKVSSDSISDPSRASKD